jgi:hypothetical protein
MDDIIQTMPWHCGERDCPVGWHQSNYWMQEDGSYTVDTYSDGDHEDIDEDDLPSSDEVDEAWRKYHADAAETGCDLLDALPVPATRKRKRKWQVVFANSIVGPVLLMYRRNGRGEWTLSHRQQPRQELTEYLLLETKGPRLVFCDPAGIRGNFKNLCKLIDDDENCQRQRVRSGLKFLVTIEETDPVVGLENKIRKAARAALRNN